MPRGALNILRRGERTGGGRRFSLSSFSFSPPGCLFRAAHTAFRMGRKGPLPFPFYSRKRVGNPSVCDLLFPSQLFPFSLATGWWEEKVCGEISSLLFSLLLPPPPSTVAPTSPLSDGAGKEEEEERRGPFSSVLCFLPPPSHLLVPTEEGGRGHKETEKKEEGEPTLYLFPGHEYEAKRNIRNVP